MRALKARDEKVPCKKKKLEERTRQRHVGVRMESVRGGCKLEQQFLRTDGVIFPMRGKPLSRDRRSDQIDDRVGQVIVENPWNRGAMHDVGQCGQARKGINDGI